MIVDPDFCDHWKTRMLVGLLGNDEAAPVYVLRLWAHCQNRRQDTFDNFPPDALKALCRFPGDSSDLESSMAQAGFVSRDGRRLTVSGWSEYNASLLAAWANGAKRGKSSKEPTVPATEPQEEPRGVPTGIPTGPREERMREEERGMDSSIPSLTPMPPPTGDGPAAWQEGWMQLRKAWNDAMPRGKWRSAEPPQQAIDRLQEPGWLEEAIAAIADIRRLAANFQTPPTLKQFCHRGAKGSFVARLLGGEFSEPKPKGIAS